MTPVYRAGHFVRCRFPTAEQPKEPGPKTRIGYVLAVQRIGRADLAALLYTTTVRWPAGDARPLGIISVDDAQAHAIGQRAFTIDIRTAAVLPIGVDFFPRLESADHGIAGIAPPGLKRKIESVLSEMRRRQVAIALRGPGNQ